MSLFYYVLAIGLLFPAVGQDMPQPVIQGNREILRLDHWAVPGAWLQYECEVKAGSKHSWKRRPTALIHVPVDFYSGEPKYPIGWPRVHLRVQSSWEKDWRSWDHFEFAVYTESSRESLPKTPLTLILYCPDRNRQWVRRLGELQIGKWVHYSLPINDMKYIDNVKTICFSVSESNYRHKDIIDFYVSGFQFTRSTECELDEMRVLSQALFPDQLLKVHLKVAGPPPEVARGIPFLIRNEQKSFREETLPVHRGAQTLEMEIEELHLLPGNYFLVAFPDEPGRKKQCPFRIVEAPWQQGQ